MSARTVIMAIALFVSGGSSLFASGQAMFDYPVLQELYVPGSYAGRSFFYEKPDGDHLGEDIKLPEGYPIKSIGDGDLIYYKTDGTYKDGDSVDGFGKLYFIV